MKKPPAYQSDFNRGYLIGYRDGWDEAWSQAIHAVGIHRYDYGATVKQVKRELAKVLRGLRDAKTMKAKGTKR